MNVVWTPPEHMKLDPPPLSVDQIYAMVAQGILSPGTRMELVRGRLVELSPKNITHERYKNRLGMALNRLIEPPCEAWVEKTLCLVEDTYVEPDITILHLQADAQSVRAEHVQLVIEIADKSLAYDRDLKAGLYAAHGLPEYWLIDVNARTVTLYRDPEGEAYRSIRIVPTTHSISPGFLPHLHVTVSEVIT